MTRHSAYLALGLLLFVLLACNFSKNGNTSNQNAAKSESASESDAKVVGTFTNRRNIVNKYILVEKGISDDKLIEMAKKLHLAEPAVNFWFLDDDSKAEELVQWVGAYEKGEATLSDPIYDWMGDHIVANVQQYFGTGGTKYWALAKGMMGEQIEKLE
jgi:hypothetical protein